MKESDLEKLKYPIGKFEVPVEYTTGYISSKIEEIANFPERLKKEIIHLSEDQLNTPYRPAG
ncbi:DinB family protein [Flavobacterium chungangense]|uniref:Metal-dependent hydrolase n=1 Tax=Flavobacterium chungangense TaxID=554283 RepID=A0A6V6ZAH8_9FLAO|nr:hypothetical protein [Flavobacterium chungangense]CAD0008750.1 metal-dependent hydrolase [Flavobacterium chungangense]